MYIINASEESSGGIRLTNTAKDRRDAAGIVKSLWRRNRFFTQCWGAGQGNILSRQFFCFRFSRSLTDLSRKAKKNWGRMGGHHELFITKFEGDLALRSPKLKNGPKFANQAS